MNDQKTLKIAENLKISVANSGAWITSSDMAALATLTRLCELIDTLIDQGEAKDLAPLLARATNLMEQLRLTPKSRADQDLTTQEREPDGEAIQQTYLRIINSSHPVYTAAKPKPRKNSGGSSGATKRATNGVAKKRP